MRVPTARRRNRWRKVEALQRYVMLVLSYMRMAHGSGTWVRQAKNRLVVRRKFYDPQTAHKSPGAVDAMERIAGLYAIESEIRGRPPSDATTFDVCDGRGSNCMPVNLSTKPEACPSNSHKRESCQSLVQDNTQERSIDLKSAVVLDEAQFLELVHEKIDPWACRADHLR
jgi:hypothetical protein